jgi:hypothetical protein
MLWRSFLSRLRKAYGSKEGGIFFFCFRLEVNHPPIAIGGIRGTLTNVTGKSG